MLLMLGSLFWQTLVFGWQFALLVGRGEGFAAFWWGSARRLEAVSSTRGWSGVVLAGLGQLLNALQEVNQWITFGLIGLLLVILRRHRGAAAGGDQSLAAGIESWE
ncbi:MAG: hypothetical protein M0C28_34155 [Candidatus Moduliflexus flocculans]|nr:hypothetical protein [Candidatus Moduliflexus flocculans]